MTTKPIQNALITFEHFGKRCHDKLRYRCFLNNKNNKTMMRSFIQFLYEYYTMKQEWKISNNYVYET